MAPASSGVALRPDAAFLLVLGGSDLFKLAEGPEHDVGEGSVHGLAHDHREDEAGGSVEGAGDHQHFGVEHEAHSKAAVRPT